MASKSRIGLHVSAAGGVENAPLEAVRVGCEVFQFFSRSPRGGGRKPLPQSSIDAFRKHVRDHGLESCIHAPYYINFASSSSRISWGSVQAIREELTRGTQLGVKYVVTHLGSKKDLADTAITQVVSRLKSVFDTEEEWSTQLLLENAAGAEHVIGNTFEELSEIFRGLGRNDVGICLDTAHLFASGYDIRTPEAIDDTIRTYKQHLPLSSIKLIHSNDSKIALGGRRDRHANIGDGYIGAQAFRHLLAHTGFRGRDFILEVPERGGREKRDIALLKRYRNEAQR